MDTQEKKEVKKIISDYLDDYATDNQYGVSKIPYHTHNGVDSPLITNLSSTLTTVVKDWQFTGIFSSVDDANAGWTAGTLTDRDGNTFSIASGATANTPSSSGNPIIIDYFNNYVVGDLTNQGRWIACPAIIVPGGVVAPTYIVENTVVNEGSNAVIIGGNQYNPTAALGKTGTTRTTGKQIFYFRVTNTSASRLFFSISADTNSSTNNFIFEIGEGGFSYDFGGGHSGSGVLSITANTWHYFSIEWRSSDHKAKVGLDGVDLIGFTATGWSTGGFGAFIMQPNCQSGATFYVDTFGGTSTVNPITYIYFDPATSTTSLQSSTTSSSAVGNGKILVGVVNPSGSSANAGFQIFGGSGGVEINSQNIADSSIFATKLDISQLSTITPSLGPITSGTMSGITSFALRDTSAAFDVTIVPTSSPSISAGRTLTFDMGNVTHTLIFGTTANTITFPSVASDTVAYLSASQSLLNKKLGSLTSNGFVKTSGGDGTLSVDTNTYLPKTSTVTATAQVADITSTNLTTTGAGLYRLAYYLLDTVADLTAGAVRLNVTYTDAGASQTQQSATVALITLGTFTQGEFIIQLASGNIAYSTTHTGIFGTATYNLYVTLERLN